jgi:hypothetical protein
MGMLALRFLQLPASSLGGLTATRLHAAGPTCSIGESARSAAAEWRCTVAFLLLNAPSGERLVNLGDAAGRCALHYAAAAGDESVVQDLLRKGAPQGAKDMHGRTAAHVAAAARHTVLAAMLAEGVPEASHSDAFGHTAHSLAALQLEVCAEVPQ